MNAKQFHNIIVTTWGNNRSNVRSFRRISRPRAKDVTDWRWASVVLIWRSWTIGSEAIEKWGRQRPIKSGGGAKAYSRPLASKPGGAFVALPALQLVPPLGISVHRTVHLIVALHGADSICTHLNYTWLCTRGVPWVEEQTIKNWPNCNSPRKRSPNRLMYFHYVHYST